MPVPRRHVSLLASAAAGTVPIYHSPQKPCLDNVIKRCGRCRCILASDQEDHWCSPCQRRFNGMPDVFFD